ncbi:MAG TPA: RluA family pseudouridine synthase [Candidatus Limiplasma sp.]|nr:RluA family pseudouridine synthase [Candidatus Limiplasma sp.]
MRELAITIAAQDEGKAVRQIALQRLSMSCAQFKRAKFQGALLLDGERVHADRAVHAGQCLLIRVPESVQTAVEPCAIALQIAYEDDDILVVDKPAPLPSVHSKKQDGITLENAVYSYLGCPEDFLYRPVNRLDKGTSGLMVVARHAHAQQYLQKRLHSDAFIREYLAVCDGVPPQTAGVIDAPIQKADGATIRRVVSAQGRPARTDYRVECVRGGRSLVRLRLHTGRTHQIRVHLASISCPVAGDFLYGTEHPLLPRRFALHSALLEMTTVNQKHIRLESAPPDVFMQLLSDQP